jgi:subtilisin family serine protease
VVDPKAADIQPLKRFVAARLTRSEVEKVAAELGAFGGEAQLVEKLWLNSVKRALINSSIHTVQALPAQEAYHACGEGVAWAVLDTGVAANHPHFGAGRGSTIVAEHDCTTGAKMRSGPGMAPDRIGHGTHVAGIIAGGIGLVHDEKGVVHPMKGMAPRCKLHIYKVLGDDGTGRDSSIIRALDHIAEINEKAGKLVIHGVNLSLGGPFDPATYGCGYSPLCRELGRLWRQGVLVVVAAGNEGLQSFETLQGQVNASMDLSINDPANLEDCIAVGSVNKLSPHSYGVSYFSSRGPTADGRCKPDVVAPGEKILSCRHQFPAPPKKGTPRLETFYVEMSGTSMAAPHVSGILAAFLSKRSEFRGQPDRVKQILMDNCTDLKRERTFQGAGLPNLVKMLVAT